MITTIGKFRRASVALLFLLFAVGALAQSPHLNTGGVVNAASFQPVGIAPGSLISLFGTGLATATASAGTLPLPTSLNGTEVLVDGLPAPLTFVSPKQINAQVPFEAAGLTQIAVQVFVNGVASEIVTAPISFSPGIFSTNQTGIGQGAVLLGNGALASQGNGIGVPVRPAVPGDFISIFATGLGEVTNPPATGAAASATSLSNLVGPISVSIGGVPATVTFAGLAPNFVGLFQINVQVPANVPFGSTVPVVLVIGRTTSNQVTIASSNLPQTRFVGFAVDPIGDAVPLLNTVSPDLVFAGGTVSNGVVALQVRFAPGTFNAQTTAVQFLLDTDLNPSTGHPGSDARGNDTGLIGADYLVAFRPTLGNVAEVFIFADRDTLSPVGTATLTLFADGADVTFPLSLLAGNSGKFDFKVTASVLFSLIGTLSGNVDYLPNIGLPPIHVQ